MATLTQDIIEEAFKTEDSFNNLAEQISKDLESNVYDIAHFVEMLGFALTSKSVDLRVKGTQILSNVLAFLPKELLNEQQLEFLSAFYADRIKDQHNVMPAVIDGIYALVHMQKMPTTSIPIMLQSFFQNTTCQSQVRGDRMKIYQIFQYLTEKYPAALKGMAADFIYGLISSIDGERDPRNLDLIFKFMPYVITNFPLLHLSEEMFETFACYFPVDFTPSSNDPDTITREKLASNLVKCLVASPEFVEWTVALATEKLETDLVAARLDSLQLLQEAALNFEPKLLETHFAQIWGALKTELFPGTDNAAVTAAGLQTLRFILERAAVNNELSHNYQTIVLGTILTHLNDVGQRLFNPATAIALVCVAGDTAFAAEKVLNTFQLKLSGTPPLTDEERIKVYGIIAQVYKIASLKEVSLKQLQNDISIALQQDIINCLRQDLDSENLNEQKLDLKRAALSVLNECAPIVNETNRALVYKTLVQLMIHEQIDLEFTHFLAQLGALYPIELQSNCLDACIRNFQIFNNFVKSKVLRNLAALVHQMAFAKRILKLIFDNIFEEQLKNDVRELSLLALVDLLNNGDQKFIIELQEQSCLIDKLINLAQNKEIDELNIKVLEQVAAVLSIVMQQLSIAEQYTIATQYLPNLNLQNAPDLFVAKGLLGFLHKDISLDDHFESLLTDLTKLSLESNNEQLRQVAHNILCSMVNKIEDNGKNRNAIMKLLHELKEEIKKENEKAVESLSWVAKGLITRGFEGAAEIVQSLSELLDHPSLHKAAMLAFNVISAEFPELDLPVIKYLFKQKFFHTVIEKFGDKLESYCEHHLSAFVCVLKNTPHSVLKMNIEKIGPILFKSLESPKTETLCITLKICERFVKHQDEYFRAHLNHLIPSCLELSKYKASMQVRISALTLLQDITLYPTFVLLPHKTDVVLELAKPLDDSKRLVRNAAVKASNAWFLVGAANSNEN